MPSREARSRRRFLAAATGVTLSSALAGCFGEGPLGGRADRPQATEPTIDPTAERPMPQTFVGQEKYVHALAASVDQDGFPSPDPDLVPALTKARFVGEASREDGEDGFADRVAELRDPVVAPLRRFDAVTVLATPDRRERLNDTQRQRLRETADLESRGVSLSDDPETIRREGLSDRERTFFDYPGPPLHVVEAAESRGLETLDRGPEERAADVDEPHRRYVRQRTRVVAVVGGAREVAAEAYDQAIDRIRNRSLSNRPYETTAAYEDVVAFNAGLAAESMLETDGELVTAP